MSEDKFESPMIAEAFFYLALERRDLKENKLSRAKKDKFVCTHQMGPMLEVLRSVRDFSRLNYSSGQELSFEIDSIKHHESGSLAVHILQENFTQSGDETKLAPVLVTNAYRQTEYCWRMVLLHVADAAIDPATLH